MRRRRISLRGRAEEIYNGRAKLGNQQQKMLPEIWFWLDRLATGAVKLVPTPKNKPRPYRVKLDSGLFVFMAIGCPARDDKDHDFDFYVVDIWWPWEMN